MEKNTSSGWARFDKQEQLDELERSMTPRLNEMANDQKHMAEARDKGRVTIANFIRAWLLREGQWGGEQFTSIIVAFLDERTQGLPQPTLTF